MEDLGKSSIRNWGRFASPEMESAYQAAELPSELKRARFLLCLTAFGVLLFLYHDYATFGLSTGLYIINGLRFAFFACVGLALLSLRPPATAQKLEIWMIVACTLLALGVLFAYASRPIERMNHAAAILLTLTFAMMVPMRFGYRVIASSTFAAASCLVLFSKRPEFFIGSAVVIITGFSVALGLTTAASMNRVQRQRFAAHQNEIQLRLKLESASAEIKTLRGMLPICAACKKIRQDDGIWRQIEAYLREHTEAQFTHGICPDCRARLYSETTPAKKS